MTGILHATDRTRTRRRAALAHQCRKCRRMWALRLVEGTFGHLVVCGYCGSARGAGPAR